MKLAKTPVQPVDLDELARQLREVAFSSLSKRAEPEGKSPEAQPLGGSSTQESAADAGESSAPSVLKITIPDKSLRSIAGGLAHVPRPVVRRGALLEGLVALERGAGGAQDLVGADIDASIEHALRNDPSLRGIRDRTSPVNERMVPASHHAPGESAAMPEEFADHEHGLDGGAAQWTDEQGDWPYPDDISPASSSGRRSLSPHVMALGAASILILLGVGGAIAMRILPLGDFGHWLARAPAQTAPPDPVKTETAGTDTAPSPGNSATSDPSPKPVASASAAPDARAAPVSPQAALSLPPASDTASPGAVRPDTASPGPSSPLPADTPSPAKTAAAASPAADPPAPSPAPAAANAPATDPLQSAAPTMAIGGDSAAHPASAKPGSPEAAVQPDETPAAEARPADSAEAAVPMDASETVTAPVPPRKPAELRIQHPDATAADDERKTAKPARAAAKLAANAAATVPAAAPSADAQSSGLRGLLHQVFGGPQGTPSGAAPQDPAARLADGLHGPVPTTHTPPAQGAQPGGTTTVARGTPSPQAAQPGGTTTIARSTAPDASSVSLKLASSTSEETARETLARLQQKFPGVLTGASVRREDLGKFGVFYRVRVNPMPRETADKVCAQLKAGGARCTLSGG